MNPKSGKAGKAVTPAAPVDAEDADVADPGKVAKVKAKQSSTKQASSSAKPHKPPQNEEEAEEKKSWIEIELVDEEDEPVPGEKYRITLPDDTVAEGTLDEKGFARVDGIVSGTCKVTFPDLDKDAWAPA